jgi:hypothetical protein
VLIPRETGMSNLVPAAAAHAASTVPPWAPTPGAKIQQCGATRRTRARASTSVAPTTSPRQAGVAFDQVVATVTAMRSNKGSLDCKGTVRKSLEPGLEVLHKKKAALCEYLPVECVE